METNDGGFIIVGAAWDTSFDCFHLKLVKTDSVGVPQWTYLYGDTAQTHGYSVCLADDGGYVATGDAWYPATYQRFYTIKVDSMGTLMWTNTGSQNSAGYWATRVIRIIGGGYLVAGYINQYEPWILDGHIVRLTNGGATAWTRNIGVPGYYSEDRFYDCVETNSGYLLAGVHDPHTGPYQTFYLVRTTTTGDTIWTDTFDNIETSDDVANGVSVLRNGNIVLAGSGRTGSYTNDAWLVETNVSGDELWSIQLQPCCPYSGATDVDTTRDGGFIVAGESFLMRFCSDDADAGHPAVLSQSRQWGAYRLLHEQGELNILAFTQIEPGSVGLVTGEAANSWSVLPGGDGNNGDSIIFVASVPLTIGSLDTFWVSRPAATCSFAWNTGCRHDTLKVWNASVDVTEFWGGHVSQLIELRLHVRNESNVVRYEVWGSDYPGHSFQLLRSIPASNDSGQHTYVNNWPWPWHQFLLKSVDEGGCVREYPELMLTVGVNVGVDDIPYLTDRFDLLAYPNPFNAMTVISLTLPTRSAGVVSVSNLLGRHITTLHDGILEPGEHKFTFDASALPSGIYFARVQSGEFVKTQKLLLLK